MKPRSKLKGGSIFEEENLKRWKFGKLEGFGAFEKFREFKLFERFERLKVPVMISCKADKLQC